MANFIRKKSFHQILFLVIDGMALIIVLKKGGYFDFIFIFLLQNFFIVVK